MARRQRLGWTPDLNTPYVNSIAAEAQPLFPGDLAIEERLGSIMRWNALAMALTFYKPDPDSPEMDYLRTRRRALGGWMPRRETECDAPTIPALPAWARFALNAEGKDMSTTSAFVRMLGMPTQRPAAWAAYRADCGR